MTTYDYSWWTSPSRARRPASTINNLLTRRIPLLLPQVVANLVMLADPEDCARITRLHVKKMPDQAIFLGDAVLSVTDNER